MTHSTECLAYFPNPLSFPEPSSSNISASQIVKKIAVSIFSHIRGMTWGKERKNLVDSHRKLEMLIAIDKQWHTTTISDPTQNSKLNELGSNTATLLQFDLVQEAYKKEALETIKTMLPENTNVQTHTRYSDETFTLAKKILLEVGNNALKGTHLSMNFSTI
jgi:hypothetical protein